MEFFGDILRAAIFAAEAHKGQKRKYTGEDYIVHPLEVAQLVESVKGDAQQIMAALLHDTVEDTSTTILDIQQHFGKDVALLVLQLTDVSKPADGNRAVRKQIDRDHIAHATPEAQTVKLADCISNAHDITVHDPHFAKVYMKEMAVVLPLLADGDERLFKMLTGIIDRYEDERKLRTSERGG